MRRPKEKDESCGKKITRLSNSSHIGQLNTDAIYYHCSNHSLNIAKYFLKSVMSMRKRYKKFMSREINANDTEYNYCFVPIMLSEERDG